MAAGGGPLFFLVTSGGGGGADNAGGGGSGAVSTSRTISLDRMHLWFWWSGAYGSDGDSTGPWGTPGGLLYSTYLEQAVFLILLLLVVVWVHLLEHKTQNIVQAIHLKLDL